MPLPTVKRNFLSRKTLLGATVGAALFFMGAGIIFWGGFNTAMEATNTLDFCISCHEMEQNVYQEYKQTVHFSNRSGVRATCSDCHVPDPWVHKMVRKVKASNELFHKAMGTVDTPEKFDEHRLQMARRVWDAMKSTDSRECRNCHDFDSMNPEQQKLRSRKQHIFAMEQGQTCIDCHKGIAHKKVHQLLEEEEVMALEQPNPAYKRPLPTQWAAFLAKEAQEAQTTQRPAAEQARVMAVSARAEAPTPAAAAQSVAAAAVAAAPTGGLDWSAVPGREVVLFYPGQTSMEWILTGSEHSGARVYRKAGDRCFTCHEGEQEAMGRKMVNGEKAETVPLPGKRPGIRMQVQAAYDDQYLHMRFAWPDTPHVPVSFVEGGKMDSQNPTKLAVMLSTDEVQEAAQAGCWGTCHHDANGMPDAPGDHDVRKYIAESRAEIDVRGSSGKRGGWDKLKEAAAIEAEFDANRLMELLRFKAGTGESEDGYVLAERVMDGGQGVAFEGRLEGDTWVVTMKRKLTSEVRGDLSLAAGQIYNIGFAIHDDHTNGRFHHVSLGYRLGFDDPSAEINAVRR